MAATRSNNKNKKGQKYSGSLKEKLKKLNDYLNKNNVSLDDKSNNKAS